MFDTQRNMPQLIKPEIKYGDQYLKAVELLLLENPYYKESYPTENLESQIKNWDSLAQNGISYRYWLIDKDDYIGTIILRRKDFGESEQVHYSISPEKRGNGYGKIILKLGLEKAKELGFDKLSLSCKKENTASQKIIQSNGGKFIKEKEVQGEKEKIILYKYDIELE